MVILTRTITKDLETWAKNPRRSPLILRGARQVGKTYVVKEFAKKHFTLAYINFEKMLGIAQCFDKLDIKWIIQAISLELGQDIISGKTLLFLDEIQDCPKAIKALRYFKEELPELHVIAAGSLLEFVLNDEKFSMPVGRVEYLYLKPLSFYEFLLAIDKPQLIDYLSNYQISDPLIPTVHEQLLRIVQEYMAIGGMPAIVAEYIASRNLNKCEDLLSDLLLSYRDDFSKYAGKNDHGNLYKLYDQAPRLIAQWFKYVNVDPDLNPRDIRKALNLLVQSGIITRVYASNGSGIPLEIVKNEKKFKLLFLDIGLVRAAQQISLKLLFKRDLILLNKGSLTEQFVGQELLVYSPKIQQNKIYFWQREKRNSQAEVDYLFIHDGEIYPLEVKAGSTGHLRSLKLFMEEKQSKIGIRVSNIPLSLNGKILSVPFYLLKELPRLLEI